jgi:hypothetical protein
MDDVWIRLEAYFGAIPIDPSLQIGSVCRDAGHPLAADLNLALENLAEGSITRALADLEFQAFHGQLDLARQRALARERVVVNELQERTSARRRTLLLAESSSFRPPPYDQPALADLPMTADLLVPLSQFEIDDGVLVRNGHAFVLLPPTSSVNSSYWITRALAAPECRDLSLVRLDPLIHGEAVDFPRISYRMLWWGPPLRWTDVVSIHDEKFGRWLPAPLSSGGEFTDFAWVPRGDEQHLFLEEVPKLAQVEAAGSRYLHAIFSRSDASVMHLDGAIRLYSSVEWQDRTKGHVRKAGKVGKRIKIFRLDGSMDPGLVSCLGGAFFVWNYDVAHFFGAEVHPLLLGQEA